MYESHFGLRELPFGITPDTAFAFGCEAHQAALNTLLVALGGGEGFVKITGEVGTGKTLLCRRLLATLPGDCITAYLPNPLLEPRGLLLSLGEELEVPLDAGADEHHLVRALNAELLALAAQDRRVVVLIDEAQAMPLATLEALRLLSNLETEKRKLLQVVLFGQPELDRRLDDVTVRQIKQRITFNHRLVGLSQAELHHYLAHRLRVAGYVGQSPFSATAVRSLHRASGGIPRLVNILAHKALMLVYGEGAHQVRSRHVRSAVRDTPSARGLLPALSGLAGTLLLAARPARERLRGLI